MHRTESSGGKTGRKRPRGIHNIRKVDNIKINLKEIALEYVDWINMIRDGLL